MTYIEAEDGKDLTFTSGGKLMVRKGSATDAEDVVYQLIEDNDTTNFLFMGDSLVMLMRDLNRVDSGLNYTIKLIESKVVENE